MIVVKVELHSAVTGIVSEIGRTILVNDGTGTRSRGNYHVAVMRKGSRQTLRNGRVEDYPRLSYNVWRLVSRALLSAFPEEAKRND